MNDPYSVPKAMEEIYETITGLTDSFCHEKLTDEHAEMCRRLTAKLCRKRPSPLARGKTNLWAAGIIHVIGVVNFDFDKKREPHIKLPDIATYFGVGKESPTAKSKVIRDLFKIGMMEPEWTLASRMDDNPVAWRIMLDGQLLDARYVPSFIQEAAFAKGLIPYVPGPRRMGPSSGGSSTQQ